MNNSTNTIMVGKMKKRPIRIIFRIIKWLSIAIGLLIIIGFTYEQIMTKVSANKYAPVGKLVNIGDYNLHLYTLGEANKYPTVILESGLGTPSSYKDWEHVQRELAKYTRVISYDRAGYGWSDAANNERTATVIANDLYQLLEKSGEKGPYILVGHSFGGFTSQVFTHKFKEEVAGLVLIDSSHVKDNVPLSREEAYFIRVLKEIGIARVLDLFNMLPLHEQLSRDETTVHFFHQHFYNADQLSELKFIHSKSVEQVLKAQASGFGQLPLYVLSAEHDDIPNWTAWQAETAALSTKSKHIVVKDASHYIHLDKPSIVVDSIIDILYSLNE